MKVKFILNNQLNFIENKIGYLIYNSLKLKNYYLKANY